MVWYFRNNEVMERIFKHQSRRVWVRMPSIFKHQDVFCFCETWDYQVYYCSDACFTPFWFHKILRSTLAKLRRTANIKTIDHVTILSSGFIAVSSQSFVSHCFFNDPPPLPRSGTIFQFPAASITSTQEEWSETRKALKEMKQRQMTPDLRWTVGATGWGIWFVMRKKKLMMVQVKYICSKWYPFLNWSCIEHILVKQASIGSMYGTFSYI